MKNNFNSVAIIVRAYLKAKKYLIPFYILMCFMLFNTGLNLISQPSTIRNIIGLACVTIVVYFNYLLLTKKDA